MNRKDLILIAVRAFNANVRPRRQDTLEDFMSAIFGLPSREERIAAEINDGIDKAAETIEKIKINRKFKKIVKNG